MSQIHGEIVARLEQLVNDQPVTTIKIELDGGAEELTLGTQVKVRPTFAPGATHAPAARAPTAVADESPEAPPPPTEEPGKPKLKNCADCGEVFAASGHGSHFRKYCADCSPKHARKQPKKTPEAQSEVTGKAMAAGAVPADSGGASGTSPPEMERSEAPPNTQGLDPAVIGDIMDQAEIVARKGEGIFVLVSMVQQALGIPPSRLGVLRDQHGDEWLVERAQSAEGLSEILQLAAEVEVVAEEGPMTIEFSAEDDVRQKIQMGGQPAVQTVPAIEGDQTRAQQGAETFIFGMAGRSPSRTGGAATKHLRE